VARRMRRRVCRRSERAVATAAAAAAGSFPSMDRRGLAAPRATPRVSPRRRREARRRRRSVEVCGARRALGVPAPFFSSFFSLRFSAFARSRRTGGGGARIIHPIRRLICTLVKCPALYILAIPILPTVLWAPISVFDDCVGAAVGCTTSLSSTASGKYRNYLPFW
jgi:hypothetical protein